jgi:hypothetical protein
MFCLRWYHHPSYLAKKVPVMYVMHYLCAKKDMLLVDNVSLSFQISHFDSPTIAEESDNIDIYLLG